MFSTTHHHNVRLKVRVPYDDAVMPTISDVWATLTGTSARRSRCSGSGSKGTRSR